MGDLAAFAAVCRRVKKREACGVMSRECEVYRIVSYRRALRTVEGAERQVIWRARNNGPIKLYTYTLQSVLYLVCHPRSNSVARSREIDAVPDKPLVQSPDP